MTSFTDKSFPYVLICSTFTAVVPGLRVDRHRPVIRSGIRRLGPHRRDHIRRIFAMTRPMTKALVSVCAGEQHSGTVLVSTTAVWLATAALTRHSPFPSPSPSIRPVPTISSACHPSPPAPTGPLSLPRFLSPPSSPPRSAGFCSRVFPKDSHRCRSPCGKCHCGDYAKGARFDRSR